jgi:hypothetical protein
VVLVLPPDGQQATDGDVERVERAIHQGIVDARTRPAQPIRIRRTSIVDGRVTVRTDDEATRAWVKTILAPLREGARPLRAINLEELPPQRWFVVWTPAWLLPEELIAGLVVNHPGEVVPEDVDVVRTSVPPLQRGYQGTVARRLTVLNVRGRTLTTLETNRFVLWTSCGRRPFREVRGPPLVRLREAVGAGADDAEVAAIVAGTEDLNTDSTMEP